MNILLVLIPISLLLLGIAIAAFVWAVKRGQYDDLDTPALDILTDDARPAPPPDAPPPPRALDARYADVDVGQVHGVIPPDAGGGSDGQDPRTAVHRVRRGD